jgi:hypothetical protein
MNFLSHSEDLAEVEKIGIWGKRLASRGISGRGARADLCPTKQLTLELAI